MVEGILAVSGLYYTLFGSDQDAEQAGFLLCWDALALAYLIVGTIRIRRLAKREPQVDMALPRWSAALYGRRFGFLITVSASLTGLGAALDVLTGSNPSDLRTVVNGLAVLAVACAFILLQVGYAHFYQAWDRSPEGPGLRFPRTEHPDTVDYLYFAVNLGVSFAVSDVEVFRRPLRWHVMVHSVVSFFYNAVVLAIAIGFITGR
jgi:uncharacterized membrane protein